jgi:tripartite-type tricarboxylate transporter receptor subunit TctC
MDRRTLMLGGLATLAATQFATAAEAAYPTRAITLDMGFPPGGFTDTLARRFMAKLGSDLNQSIIIVNKPGGGTSIATAEVARAKPDGYTLLLGVSSLAIYPTLQPKSIPHDPVHQLAPIAKIHESPFVLLITNDVPAKNLKEFIAYAKANPNKINVGSAGVGTVNHLLIEMFNTDAGVHLTHVPYKGGAAFMLDLRAGRTQAVFATPLDALPYLKEGKGIALGVTSTERLALLKDVPALSETVPGFHGVYWTGLFAPVGTPEPVIRQLAAAVAKTAKDKDLIANADQLGATFNVGTPEQLHEFLIQDTETYRKIIQGAHIQPE